MKYNFEFVPLGTELSKQEGKLALDVGNKVDYGVLDHHHHIGKSCTVNLVMEHPEKVSEWIKGDSVTFILHQTPDIDGTTAAYVAWCLLRDKKLPHGVEILAEHIKASDQGAIEQPDPKAPLPYEIYMIISNLVFDLYKDGLTQLYEKLNLASLDEKQQIATQINELIQERDLKVVSKGFELMSFIFDSIESVPLDKIDLKRVFAGYHPFKEECKALERDFELYTQDLHDHKRTRPFIIKLPRKGTGTPMEVAGLYWVDPTPKLFKLWARTDRLNAQVGNSFVFMMIKFSHGSQKGTPRWVLSVDPNSSVDLVGLGRALNHFEAIKRQELGVVLNAPPRSGYSIADPWYDGRGHDFTIVDSPNQGSVLDRADIENYVRSFSMIDLFSRIHVQNADVFFLFFFNYDSKQRQVMLSNLQKDHWSPLTDEPPEIMPAIRQYFYAQKIHDRRQTIFFEHSLDCFDLTPNIKNIKIGLTNQNTGILSVSVKFSALTMPELFEWNAKWKLGFSLSSLLDSKDSHGGTQAMNRLSNIAGINSDDMIADYVSWGVKMEDMHLARDAEFYDHVLAAFVSNKLYPINVMQSDLESVRNHIELGQYGRIITRNGQSFCFVNTIDQEMSREEQNDVWQLYHGSCYLMLLNAGCNAEFWTILWRVCPPSRI